MFVSVLLLELTYLLMKTMLHSLKLWKNLISGLEMFYLTTFSKLKDELSQLTLSQTAQCCELN